MKPIRKLVLPVAGLGRRMRPLTLRRPKALIPLRGVPMIEYVLEEARETGIREVILIVSPRHRGYFGKYLKAARIKFPGFVFHIRVQEEPFGNGHAILQALDLLRGEPFAVRFCDDLIVGGEPVLSSLLALYAAYRVPVLLLERVPKIKVSRYGVVGVEREKRRREKTLPRGNLFRLTEIVEKPRMSKAPSNLIIIGGYVLTPEILENLKRIADSLPHPGPDALPLAVALQVEFIVGGKVLGWEFTGKRLDCGTLENLKRTEAFLGRQSA